jgi:NAD(P)-dependent dehydrogenase (short-subunit alcohol dehydrogenase family)
MSTLHAKTAVVTGGSKGIGLAIARRLIEEGCEVTICGRNREALASAVASLGSRAWGVVCDVRDPQAVGNMFREVESRHAGLDILVNNAGVGVFKPIAEITNEEWRSVIETNLNGVFYCCRAATPLMRRRGGGYIINISSLAGKNAFAGGTAYNASKFGLNGFSEALMLDLRYDKIRVSYVMPGSVATDFTPGSAQPWKLQAADVAQAVLDLLHMPENALASRVELRPLLPPKR